jgi:hypothetical protein
MKSRKIKGIEYVEDPDYVIYSDTDSLYLSASPLMEFERIDVRDHAIAKQYTIKTAKFFASSINSFYDVMMSRMFNTKSHRIKIAEDVIASCALWIAKKRYVMLKVYDMEKEKDLDYKLDAKGIDIVRTSFPVKFKELLENAIRKMLTHRPKKEVDALIIKFKDEMLSMDVVNISKNAPAKFSSKPTKNRPYELLYDPPEREPFTFVKGTTGNAKAALAYNDMLDSMGLKDTLEPIYEGAKIKWIYLRENPYGLDQIGFKSDGTDPDDIMDFVTQYVDREQIFQKEVYKKLKDIYDAIGWEIFNENLDKMEEFFSFE